MGERFILIPESILMYPSVCVCVCVCACVCWLYVSGSLKYEADTKRQLCLKSFSLLLKLQIY